MINISFARPPNAEEKEKAMREYKSQPTRKLQASKMVSYSEHTVE